MKPFGLSLLFEPFKM